MAIIKRMYPKGKDNSEFFASFLEWNRKREERAMASYQRKIKESLKSESKKTGTNQ